LNETRKEVWLDVNDEMDEEENYRIISITRPLQRNHMQQNIFLDQN
jgi:hypothetical protein